jgi:mannose-1-phosphate guanylyltransferase
MVLAAGLGTRLRPITYEIPKPMVPVLDRPLMAHVVALLDRHGYDRAIANLHLFPDAIREHFGDRLEYSVEEEPLGTAGGVRNCADFFEGQRFLVISGDALTDVDLDAFRARHEQAGGIATLAVKRVEDVAAYGVVVHDSDGRVSGIQEKPDPAEALSDLANCGIYLFEPEIFDFFPDGPAAEWSRDIFPVLLDNDIPFHVHVLDEYWSDLGSPDQLREATFDAVRGELRVEVPGEQLDEGLRVGEGSALEGVTLVEPPVWIGRDVRIGEEVRLQGPLAIGDGAVIGDGAALRDSVVFPGTLVAPGAILVGAIAGQAGIVESLRR